MGRPVKDEYGRQIGRIASFMVTPSGRVDGVFIEHGDGKFLSYPSDHFRIDNGDFVILPPIKMRARALCQEIPLIWRKDQALNELLGKKKIPSEMFEDLHKNFEGALNQLKADAKSVLEDIDKQIARCTRQIQELHSALINLEIEREIGRIDDQAYQKALEMIQWGLKGVNAEKSDFETLRNKLSNMLLGEKKIETTEIPTQKETHAATAPASPTLPEPPVVVHVKSPNKQST
ncbi:MAG: CdvA-like protein [Candidatus Bathyarchaeaceae archaeon]